jgi:hypothetical protein
VRVCADPPRIRRGSHDRHEGDSLAQASSRGAVRDLRLGRVRVGRVGETSTIVEDFGNGYRITTHIVWAVPDARGEHPHHDHGD